MIVSQLTRVPGECLREPPNYDSRGRRLYGLGNGGGRDLRVDRFVIGFARQSRLGTVRKKRIAMELSHFVAHPTRMRTQYMARE